MKNLRLVVLFFVITACSNQPVIDEYDVINNQNWTYSNKIIKSFLINDVSKPYNIYINFRHTADYKYANVWLRLHEIQPDKKKITERKEFQLALADGEWLGKGSGNLYNYQLIYKENYRFPKTGKYSIVIEQNMRDNPLRHISDVGLLVEESR